MTEPLDPLHLPLRGARLIEASAGTGKTWTIAALYLRLVLGHGAQDEAFDRPLLPREILVMTFTRAATRELSDRIRQRLVQAAACFRDEAVPASGDDFLAALLAQHPQGPARQAAAWRLASAAQAMDDAAVLTLDAWCQRMLREHAFDSGSLFDEELLADPAALRAQAVSDYWREHVCGLDDDALSVVLAHWPEPEALERALRSPLEQSPAQAVSPEPLAARLGPLVRQRRERLAALKSGWVERAARMREWLETTGARRPSPLNGNKLRSAHYRRWLDDLAAWAADAVAGQPDLSEPARHRLRPEGIAEAVKDGESVELPDDFAAFADLMDGLQALPDPGRGLLAHAAAHVGARLQQLKQLAGSFGFTDLQWRLHDALDESRCGDAARRLRERILAQTPAVLVDEFQDTSPLQLAILDRLHGLEHDDPRHLLLMIGDPKQSIYGFRGADIYSYLRARRATHGRHHGLVRNHRSTAPLVAAVNRLFAQAQARPGAGALMFRGEPLAEGEDLPYVQVQAQGRADRLVASPGDVPALTWCLDGELRSQGKARERMAQECAQHIASLLADDHAGFVHPDEPFRRLRPADIAVLVRNAEEARAVRGALRRRRVASVYLSDRDSVLASDEAADLLLLMQAVASPRDLRLARAALATSLMGLSLEELCALADDEACFEAHVERLHALHEAWRGRGVLAMVRTALQAFGLPSRWRAGDDGGRRMTNVLHLAELLQAAAGTLEGEQALLRWLADGIEDARTGLAAQDEQLLRLESDADLVQVVTVHKSKGLEYPLVCLPFAAHFRAAEPGRGGSGGLFLPRAGGQRRWVPEPDDDDWALADRERQREDLRLLYVALTRARHALWVGASVLRIGQGRDCVWHRSALGYLLTGASACEPEAAVRAVLERHDPTAGVEVVSLDVALTPAQVACTRWHGGPPPPPLAEAVPYAGRFDRAWSIGSYSALVRDATRTPASAPLAAGLGLLREDEPAESPGDEALPLPPRPAHAPWHRFPRGAWAGNVLHELLEWLAAEQFALEGAEGLRQALARRCERLGWAQRTEDLQRWLERLCSVPLPPLGVSLRELRGTRPELEFWLPSQALDAGALDALCRRHIWPGEPRPALPERTLHGMLMGFADLVFEHDGRFWVMDYKSNALGPGDADYGPEAMRAAMLQHRYDVQAVLYLLALHRLLRARLRTAYDPGRHLGGALYWFLHGVASPAAGCLHLPPPVALIDALDAMAARGLPAAGDAR